MEHPILKQMSALVNAIDEPAFMVLNIGCDSYFVGNQKLKEEDALQKSSAFHVSKVEKASNPVKVPVKPEIACDFGDTHQKLCEKYGPTFSLCFHRNGCRLSVHSNPKIIHKAKSLPELLSAAL